MIESRTTRRFRAAFAALPEDVQAQARRTYALFRSDPNHPSLRFKKVIPPENVYSVRIGIGYRALGILDGAVISWFWIGSHGNMTGCSELGYSAGREIIRQWTWRVAAGRHHCRADGPRLKNDLPGCTGTKHAVEGARIHVKSFRG